MVEIKAVLFDRNRFIYSMIYLFISYTIYKQYLYTICRYVKRISIYLCLGMPQLENDFTDFIYFLKHFNIFHNLTSRVSGICIIISNVTLSL